MIYPWNNIKCFQLEESLHECKEKYNVMKETHKSLLEDVSAAIKFENQVLGCLNCFY